MPRRPIDAHRLTPVLNRRHVLPVVASRVRAAPRSATGTPQGGALGTVAARSPSAASTRGDGVAADGAQVMQRRGQDMVCFVNHHLGLVQCFLLVKV